MKSRLRQITIDGRTYAWTVHDTGGHYGFGKELWVWGAGKNSAPLHARLREAPKPGQVRLVIEYGLEHGWDPDGRGPLVDTGIWQYSSAHTDQRDRPSLVRVGSAATGW